MSLELRHFAPWEFECPCGKCDGGYARMSEDLLGMLDEARERAGIPFKINSAYRCPAHNKAVGGVPDSAHVHGKAADIAAPTSAARYAIAKTVLELGAQRLGVASGFIHVDVDDSKPLDMLWTY